MIKIKPEQPHGGPGEHEEKNKQANSPASAISGTTVIPSRKMHEQIRPPKVQPPEKKNKKTN